MATDCSGARAERVDGTGFLREVRTSDQFKYWKQKYRKDRPDLRFAPVVAKGTVSSSHSARDEGLTLEVGKARIRIQPGFDRALLLQAVQALGADE